MGRLLDAAKARLEELGWNAEINRDKGMFHLSCPTIHFETCAEVEGAFYPGAYLDEEILRAIDMAIRKRAKEYNVFEEVTRMLSGKFFEKEDLIWSLIDAEDVKAGLCELAEKFRLEKIRESTRQNEPSEAMPVGGWRSR